MLLGFGFGSCITFEGFEFVCRPKGGQTIGSLPDTKMCLGAAMSGRGC